MDAEQHDGPVAPERDEAEGRLDVALRFVTLPAETFDDMRPSEYVPVLRALDGQWPTHGFGMPREHDEIADIVMRRGKWA